MLNAGTETGSYSRSGDQTPTVGAGVTVVWWTDREAGTIIAVTPKTFTVQIDHAKRIDKNGMSEMQTYEYSPNPNGKRLVFRRTKRGWRSGGLGVTIGHRNAYHDFSF